MPTPPFRFFAIVPPGLEALAAAELTAAGQPVEVVHGGLAWEGDWEGLMIAHLHSRIASRILIRIVRFGSRALGELERKAGAVSWEDWIPPERLDASKPPVRVEVSCRRSRLYHEGAVRERVLRALGWDTDPRADSGTTGPVESQESSVNSGTSGPVESHEAGASDDDPWRLHVRVHRDTVTLSIDATGDHLHRRGYRRMAGTAPLRETLAAAALLGSGWDPKHALVDPFAGAGTIVIEGALIARRIPPALARANRQPPDFPFLRWDGAPGERWDELIEEARSGIRAHAPSAIFASDRDGRVLEALEANARAAGVDGDLQITQATMTRGPLPPLPRSEPPEGEDPPSDGGGGGWIVTNPPYGARLGERRKLRPLYRALGRELAGRWKGWGWCGYIGDPVLLEEMARELARSDAGSLQQLLQTRNGGLAVTLVSRPPPRPPDPPDDP